MGNKGQKGRRNEIIDIQEGCHLSLGIPWRESFGCRIQSVFLTLAWTCALLSGSGVSLGQEWPHYGADLKGSKYSPLDQINRNNVGHLKVAWTYRTGDVSDGTGNPIRSAFECTPLVIEGVMYLTTPFSRVIALEAESGKPLWRFDPKLNRELPYPQFVNRGVAFWRQNKERRIFVGTLDGRLFCLDATNGKPVRSFGRDGVVDLRLDAAEGYADRLYGMTSPPLIYKNLVIAGSVASDGQPQGPSGDVRAFDVKSGKLVWRFHVVPRPGEFGHDTWEGGSWKGRGGTNAWSILSCDEERGILYLPLTSPAYDGYGGDRKGENLFGNSLVALDARTGKRLWHYQMVHHDLWDYDLPSQPNLIELSREGKLVPAVIQLTKMGFTFVFDRVSGKPLFEIEERKVPPSTVPGEQAWETQPIPVKPPPITRQAMSQDEITDVTPASRAECLRLLEEAQPVPMYQPWGLDFTIHFPAGDGGPNWGGASYDPDLNYLFVNSMDVGVIGKLERTSSDGGRPAYGIRGKRFWDSNQFPCQKPPWGTLSAIDLSKGKLRWQVPLGVVEELAARGVPPTGAPNIGGSIVTAGGLVFIAATNDSRFRAFDKETGKELWVAQLPASGHATPMTFKGVKTGKQFVVIAAGGGHRYSKSFSDALIAFALPRTSCQLSR